MITVTRLDDSKLMINVEKIQAVRATPDTVITFTNRDRLMIKEPVEELGRRIVAYRQLLHAHPDPQIS